MQICIAAFIKGSKPSGIHLQIRFKKSLTASFMEQSPDTELNPALDRLPFPTTQYVYMHSLIALCLKFHFGVSSEFDPCPGLSVWEKIPLSCSLKSLEAYQGKSPFSVVFSG